LAEELGGGVGCKRRREKVALSEEATEILEAFKVPGFLDSLGADFKLPLAAKGKDEVDHIVTRAICEHVCDQATFDFDKVDREASQVCERGGSAPVVVDGCTDVQPLELRENR
jgi:hypothetical protein